MSFKIGDALVYLGVKDGGLEKGLGESKKKTDSWVSSVSAGIGIALGDAIVNTVGRGIQAIGNMGKEVVNFASDSRQATANLQSELGTTAEEAQTLGEIAKRVWSHNFSDNVLEAADAVGIVRRQMSNLSAEGIQQATEMAFAFRDAYGADLPQSISAARTLMENFNLTQQEAWDFMAAGYQRGLDRSGDFLDSINEYAPQFQAAEATAGQFFSAMQTGLQGGMLGTDRALDMFKEFRVRLLDGSETTALGLRQIGLSMDDVTERINSGQASVADIFTEVNSRLSATDDTAVQMQAGVALLGTQFEDMGTQAALATNLAAVGMEDLEGAADAVGARYNTLGNFFQGMGRRLTAALEPAAGVFLDFANEAMPTMETAFQRIEANAKTFAAGFVGIIKGVAAVGRSFFQGFRRDGDAGMTQTAQAAGGWGRNIVVMLARGMAGAMTAVVQVLNAIGRTIANWLKPGSPPRITPDIDKWGAGMIDAWLEGAESADVGRLSGLGKRINNILGSFGSGASVAVFNKISSGIQGLLRSVPGTDKDQGLIGRIMGSRGAVAAAIAEIERTGTVGKATYDMLGRALSPLPKLAQDYVRAMLDVAAADKAVAAAQEALTAVTQKYEDQLKPINAELAAIQRQKADQADDERLAELRQAIARGALSAEEEELAQMEIRRIELEKQKRALEDERDTAVDAAQEKLTAAELEQQAAQDALALQEALMQAQQDTNALIGQQISLLQGLAGAMAGIGEGLADAISGAAGGGIDLSDLVSGAGDGLGLDEAIGSELEGLMDNFDLEGIMAEVQSAFAPLQTEVEGLGETFGGLQEKMGPVATWFQNAGATIRTFIDEHAEPLKGVIVGVGAAFVTAQIATYIQGIIAALTILGGPVTWIIGLIGLLAAAWVTDFGGIRGHTQEFVDWATAVFTQFWTWLQGLWQQYGDQITTVATGIWNGLGAIFQFAVDRILTIFRMWKLIFKGDWYGLGQELRRLWDETWGAIKKLVTDWWPNHGKPAFQNLWTSLKTWWSEIEWNNLGQNIIDGLVAGISAKLADAKAAMLGIGSALKEAWDGFWDSHSPSRLMQKSAGDIFGGFTKGTDQLLDTVAASMKNAAQTAYDAFTAPPGAAEPAAADVGQRGPAAGQVIVQFLGDIILRDDTAVDAFMAFLQGLNDDAAVAKLSTANLTF